MAVGETTQNATLAVREKMEGAIKSLNIHVAETGISVGVISMNYASLPPFCFKPPDLGGSGSMGWFGAGGAGGR
jgi:hypothetical protein